MQNKQLEAQHYIRVAKFTLQQMNGKIEQQQQQQQQCIGVQLS